MSNEQASPLVLISIVTWNHAASIAATLQSIKQQTHKNLKVVVLDNDSTDETIQAVQPYINNEDFLLIKNKRNDGFCGGHNLVLSRYTAPYVLLANPDVLLNEDYIEQTLKAFEIDSRIGAVCGLLVQSNDADPIIDSTGMQLLKSRRFTLRNHGNRLSAVNIQSGYVAGLDGALPLFKQEAIQSILLDGNFFNPLFFAHKEDWDVSWRLLLYGWKTYFNKDSVAVHPRHFQPDNLRTRLKINDKIKYDAFKNQFLLLLINEDRINFLKDSLSIVPRLVAATFFCVVFERKSLKTFSFLFLNRKPISRLRKQVQANRLISFSDFRRAIQ